MLLDKVKLQKKIPLSDDYEADRADIEFYRLSYESSGSDYTLGDCPAGAIIPMFECESHNDWNVRRKQTPTRSYVSGILNKYNAAVFRNEPLRQVAVEQLYLDADGYGTSLNSLMRKALLCAQTDGCAYLLADSTNTDTEIQTIAQRQATGVRPYIRLVKSEYVINYHEVEESLLEAFVLMCDELGNEFVRYMDDSVFCDIQIDSQMRVTAIGEVYSHGYPSIPLVPIEPLEEPQSKDISYSQRHIVNLLSLIQQELVDHVFTKHLMTGFDMSEDESKKITYGSKRMLIVKSKDVAISNITADHGAAESLRKQIDQEQTNLLQAAGFANQNVSPTNVSGFALTVMREDFFLICDLLKSAIEHAENKVMALIAAKEGVSDVVPSVYSSRFVADDDNAELSKLRDLLALDLPATFKRLAIRDYINKFYNVSEEDMLKIEQELLAQ